MKKLTIGILAHVDAGKTSLAESILYTSGNIRELGRVDHKDAFLDTFALERERGITIYSKQATFKTSNYEITLLDTPGHVDFSTEMERTLSVLDYAILVINASDGVQGHTETLWRLLKRYKIPTFIFVNKMDLQRVKQGTVMKDLKKLLSDACIDFTLDEKSNEFMESIAMSHEQLLEDYLDNGFVNPDNIVNMIRKRKVFPCYFGSALKIEGIDRLIYGIDKYSKAPSYPKAFAAKVYKISRDDQGKRLTYMKITGGSLKVKMQINQEKIDQIRIYSGDKYEGVDKVEAGSVCAVTGLNETYPGQGLGSSSDAIIPMLEPVLNYKIILPDECNVYSMLSDLHKLEDEDPQLQIVWSEQLKEIHIKLMGQVQVEILKRTILDRFDVDVEFGRGNILYKETIESPVLGVGHFEPLGHYSEVHLLLEGNEPGRGLEFHRDCSEDKLDGNWQRLILTHLQEKEHIGVLTGSPITDVKITLINGRAHNEHTVGGDFRQATYRAVRQGLKKAKSILLEPYYDFTLTLPSEHVGRGMTDIQRMSGKFEPPEIDGEMSILTGYAPVATMMDYHREVISYTSGRGRLFSTLGGYLPCHNAEEVIEAMGYDSERDIDNPTSSVFCANGAGFNVQWDKVEEYMHLESWDKLEEKLELDPIGQASEYKKNTNNFSSSQDSWVQDKELEDIFIRTYGPINQKTSYSQNRLGYEKKHSKPVVEHKKSRHKKSQKEYLLVDGYNIIFAWDELRGLAEANMDAARDSLIDILNNYQGYKDIIVILVFDAYKVKGGVGSINVHDNINVVYTKEAETADEYIEKVTHEIADKHHVTVATSDALEQLIIMGKGAYRLSANDLKDEINRVKDEIRRDYIEKNSLSKAYIGDKIENDILTESENKKQ